MLAILDFKMDITYTGSYISPMDVLTRVVCVYIQKHVFMLSGSWEIKYIVKFCQISSKDHVLDDPIFHQTCYFDDI